MSSFLFMKILESTPERYDRGMQMLSHGRIGKIYDYIAETAAGTGKTVLDIGCGTGNLSIACAEKGSSVIGIDINAGMLEIAQRKAIDAGLDKKIQFLELGVAEMKNRFEGKTFDALVSCLAFSELPNDEQAYAVSAAYSILKPGGVLMIADEVEPVNPGRRVLHSLIQTPVRILTYVLTQSGTKPVKDLDVKIRKGGFVDVEITRTWGDSFMIITARIEVEQ